MKGGGVELNFAATGISGRGCGSKQAASRKFSRSRQLEQSLRGRAQTIRLKTIPNALQNSALLNDRRRTIQAVIFRYSRNLAGGRGVCPIFAGSLIGYAFQVVRCTV